MNARIRNLLTASAALGLLFAAAASLASPLTVTSYSMNNGDTGSWNYLDFTYTPCGSGCNTPQAPLSGGTGKLTDGVSPLVDWIDEGLDPTTGGLTSWVGWDSSQGQPNPLVNFDFAQTVTIESVTFWLSNTRTGQVELPASISVGGTNHVVAQDAVSIDPRAVTFSDLSITGPSIDVQFFQRGFPSTWVMVGEVSFNGAVAVPEPATLALLGLGLAGLGFSRRKP
jgi:hypothetical protein